MPPRRRPSPRSRSRSRDERRQGARRALYGRRAGLRAAQPRRLRAQPLGRGADRARRRPRRARRDVDGRPGRMPRPMPSIRPDPRPLAPRSTSRWSPAFIRAGPRHARRRSWRRESLASSARSRIPMRASPDAGMPCCARRASRSSLGLASARRRRDHRGHILRVTRGRPMTTLKLRAHGGRLCRRRGTRSAPRHHWGKRRTCACRSCARCRMRS